MSGELTRARQAQAPASWSRSATSCARRSPRSAGYAEGLEEQAIPPAEAARVIATEAGRLERLVADLLDLARLGRADFAVGHEPVDLSQVVRHAVERHLPQARELSVELSGAACARPVGGGRRGPDPPGRVEPDRERAAPHARGRIGGGPSRAGPDRRARHRPRARSPGHPPGLRALLSARPLPQRATRRLGAGPGDRAGAGQRNGRERRSGRRPRAAGRSSLSDCRRHRRAPLRQMLSDLTLDPLQGVVDRLAVAPDPAAPPPRRSARPGTGRARATRARTGRSRCRPPAPAAPPS